MNILILEISTTSAKAMLYEPDSSSVLTEKLIHLSEDTSCHNSEKVFLQTCQLGRKLTEGKKIDIISIVTTWHSLLLCDNAINPISPVYLWSNLMAESLCSRYKENREYSWDYYQKTGCIVSSNYPFFKALLLEKEGSKARIKRNFFDNTLLLDQGSYSMYHLTGHLVVLNSMASGTGFYNVQERCYDTTLLSSLKITENQLPKVVSSGLRFPLNIKGAELLGLPIGTPVIAPGPDGAFNQIGAGGLTLGIMTLSVGTSGALRMFTNKPVLSPNQSTWCYALEEGWLVGAATSGACNCVDSMKALLFPSSTSFEVLENNLQQIVPSLDYPIFMPFMFGERSPGWNNQRISGLVFDTDYSSTSSVSSIIHYYCTLEGVLFNLYQCYVELSQQITQPTVIKLSGGILNSPYWMQLCADIFGRSLEISELQHTSLLGGAILAQTGTMDLMEEKKFGSKPPRVIEPNLKNHAFYKKRFEKYLTIYHKED